MTSRACRNATVASPATSPRVASYAAYRPSTIASSTGSEWRLDSQPRCAPRRCGRAPDWWCATADTYVSAARLTRPLRIVELLRRRRLVRELAPALRCDAGVPGDVRDARLQPLLREDGARRLENPLEVALRVCAEVRRVDDHQAATATTSSAPIDATCRRRIRAAITAIAESISPAPTRNASWNPSTSAVACVTAWTALVLLAATDDRIASPSAPPTCCEVLNRPDASPESAALMLVVAISVTGTNVSPIPIDITTRPGNRSARYAPCTGMRLRSTRPTAASAIPAIGTSRTPRARIAGCASPAPITIPKVIGTNAAPALSGLYPRISC